MFTFTKRDVIRVLYAFAFAFLGVYVPLASGWSAFHNWNDLKAAAVALIPAAIAAGLSAAKNLVLPDGSLAKG